MPSGKGTLGMTSIAIVASFFVRLKSFRPIWTIAGLWDVCRIRGGGGDSDTGRNGCLPGVKESNHV